MTNHDRERITREKLRRYQLMRQKVKEANADIGLTGMGQGSPVQTSIHSDPTAKGAEKLLSMIEDEEWIAAIDDALAELKRYSPLIEQIVRIHFRLESQQGYKRRATRRARVDLMTIQAISDSEYYNRLNSGIQTVMIHAASRGLFRTTQ